MKNSSYPFRDIRTGVEINNITEEIAECYRISHNTPEEMNTVQTAFGKWFWGKCSCCKYPIESWSHSNYCGHCGKRIEWKEFDK